MRSRVSLAAIGVALVATVPGLEAQDDRFEWSGRIDRGDRIEVKGITGDIRAVATSGSQVEVMAIKRGRRRNFDEVQFEVVEDSDGVTICAVYPPRRGSRRRRGEPYRCETGGWRNNVSIDDVDVDVDFEVRVPSGVLFTGRTVSGNVEVEDLDSFVLARTVSGDIYVSTSDLADAVTVSGSIDVAMGRADWRGDLEFHTVSGDITISFPESLNTEIEFETLSGDMDSDFPITMTSRRNRWIGGRISGTIGEGGRSLSLKTVSGDVRLRRAR